MLADWLARPHIRRWWRNYASLQEVREHYLPRIRGDSAVSPYLANLEGRPVGYVQSYVASDLCDGRWPQVEDPGVRGIDVLLADGGLLDQGLGTRLVTAFAAWLFEDPTVGEVRVDPVLDNGRAIRCYLKAGFREMARVESPDGPAILMKVSRRDLASAAGRQASA